MTNKSTADMQPAPATEQATIAQAFARDFPKPTATHTSVLMRHADHWKAYEKGYLVATQAERVQSSESIDSPGFYEVTSAYALAVRDGNPALAERAFEAMVKFIDARRATASKAEAVRKPVAWKYRALAGNGEWRVTLSEDWARSINGTIDVIPLYENGIAATTKQGTP